MQYSDLLLSKEKPLKTLRDALLKKAVSALQPPSGSLYTIINPSWFSDNTICPDFISLLVYLRRVIHDHNIDIEFYGYGEELPLKDQIHSCSLLWEVTVTDHKLLGFKLRGSIFRIRYDTGSLFLSSVMAVDDDGTHYEKPYLDSVGISYLDYGSEVSETEIQEKAIHASYRLIERGLNILGRKDI